jgi:hypothetical protein
MWLSVKEGGLGRRAAAAFTLAAALVASGCGDDDEGGLVGPPSGTPAGRLAYGVDASNTLVTFGVGNPTVRSTAAVTITGLQSGETVLGIDYRPAGGVLFALGSSSRIYTLNPATGVATALGTAAFTPALTAGAAAGLDFNPVADRIRVHNSAEQDLRINPNDGVALTDGALAFVAGDVNAGKNPSIAGTAYTNSFAGTTSTVLFAIDSDLDALVTLDTPNNGQLRTIGALGVTSTEAVGFDIPGAGAGAGTAYATLTPMGGTRSRLYTVSLTTGAATLVGELHHNRPLIGIAVTP